MIRKPFTQYLELNTTLPINNDLDYREEEKIMEKQICTRCVMDNVTDEKIKFKADGTCNYCNYALSRINKVYHPNLKGQAKLKSMINLLKKEGKRKEFDCLMGISGGLDSTYLAYLGAKEWGLRILAVHIDDGFDTEEAKLNIEKLYKKTNINLITEKPDKDQYVDLIKAFIRAGVPGIAIPQDNVLLACLKNYAEKYNIKYFLSGANFSLESILQRGKGHVAADGTHIRAIHKKYGERSLTSLPLITLFERYIGQKYIHQIKTLRPLDLIDYKKEKAIQKLKENIEFAYYGGKHYESIFTKFVQSYYLPKKFHVDKRKSHYSSLIISNQMTRDEALRKLEEPLYNGTQMEKDINLILQTIDMSRTEFDRIMKEAPRSHDEYNMSFFTYFAAIARKARTLLGE